MKKIIIIALALAALTGCASRTGTAALVGGTVGYIIGKEAHAEQHRPAPVVTREVVIVQQPDYTCNKYHIYSERSACERGVRQRLAEEQRRRDNEAYKQGYGR